MPAKILLVEDSADDEALTLRALRNVPVLIVVARDGEAALARLGLMGKAVDSLPHLVLLDIKIPKVNGLEVLNRIRANEATRELPVVVLSSSDEPSDVSYASTYHASSYLRKPVDYNEFIASIRAVVEQFIDPALFSGTDSGSIA